MSDGTALFSRDFDALEAGDRFTSRGRTVTEADVVGFAGLTGDFHPQHTDEEWARERRFGGRVAHGMLVLSYALGLVPFDPERIVALRRITDAVFKRPVVLGDTIHVEGRIESAEEVDGEHGLVGSTWRVVNERGQMVARLRVEVVWRRGSAWRVGDHRGQLLARVRVEVAWRRGEIAAPEHTEPAAAEDGRPEGGSGPGDAGRSAAEDGRPERASAAADPDGVQDGGVPL